VPAFFAAGPKTFSDNGQLAPDEAINNLVKQRLEQPDASQGFILVREREREHLGRTASRGETQLPDPR